MPVITAVAADLEGSCGRGTHRVKVDAALLPNFTRGNARADDLVRNNGYAANAIQLHQDHIVGSFSGSVIAQAGAIWASGRKKPVPFPARLKRHGKSLPRMTAAALTLSENARLP